MNHGYNDMQKLTLLLSLILSCACFGITKTGYATMTCVIALKGEIYSKNYAGQTSTVASSVVGDGSSCVYGDHELKLLFKESSTYINRAPYVTGVEEVHGEAASAEHEKILSFIFRKNPEFHIKEQDFANGQLQWIGEWDSNLITGKVSNVQSDSKVDHNVSGNFWNEYEARLSFHNDGDAFDASLVNGTVIARELGGIRRFASNGSWTERRARIWITLRAAPSLYFKVPPTINGTCSEQSCMYPADIGVSTDSSNLFADLSFSNVAGNDVGSLFYRVDDCNGSTGGNFQSVQNGAKLFSNGKLSVYPEFTKCKITFKADRIKPGIATWSVPLVLQVP